MSTQNRESELADRDYQLHEEAGLIPSRDNEDEELEWIGDDKKWKKYEELKEAESELVPF